MIRNAVSEILNGSIIFCLRPPHSGSATYNRTSTTNTNLPAPGNHLSCWIDTGGYLEHTTGGFGFWSTMLLTPRLVALPGIVLALCTLRLSDAKEFRTTSVSSSPQWWPPLHPPGDRPWKASDIASEPHESLTKTSSIATVASLSGGAAVRTPHQAPSPTTKGTASCVSWFRPGSTSREKTLALWLLVWNSLALGDALLFTFRPSQNLNGYLVGEWGLHTLAMTRMLANCQLGLIASSVLVALRPGNRI